MVEVLVAAVLLGACFVGWKYRAAIAAKLKSLKKGGGSGEE